MHIDQFSSFELKKINYFLRWHRIGLNRLKGFELMKSDNIPSRKDWRKIRNNFCGSILTFHFKDGTTYDLRMNVMTNRQISLVLRFLVLQGIPMLNAKEKQTAAHAPEPLCGKTYRTSPNNMFFVSFLMLIYIPVVIFIGYVNYYFMESGYVVVPAIIVAALIVLAIFLLLVFVKLRRNKLKFTEDALFIGYANLRGKNRKILYSNILKANITKIKTPMGLRASGRVIEILTTDYRYDFYDIQYIDGKSLPEIIEQLKQVDVDATLAIRC
ncbi:MAG: hypothetical protein WCQ86_08110 [Bacteroidaceae bacterium]